MSTSDEARRGAPESIQELADHGAQQPPQPLAHLLYGTPEEVAAALAPRQEIRGVPTLAKGQIDVAKGIARDYFDEVLEMAAIPPELARQLEDGSYPGTCAWGHCNREQIGWATCADESCPCPEGWVAICDPCSRGVLPPIARGPGMRTWHPVGRLVTFDDVHAVRKFADGTPIYSGPDRDDSLLAADARPTSLLELVAGTGLGLLALGVIVVGLNALFGWIGA